MAEMHASKDQLPAEKLGEYEGRMTQFGDDYYVNFESIPASMGGAELLGPSRRRLPVRALGLPLQG